MVGVAAWGRFYDRVVAFPIEVEECNSAILTFEVAAETARGCLPPGGLELIEAAPGVTTLVVSATEFLRTGYPPCRELTFSFPARPIGSAEFGLFMHMMPTDHVLSYAVSRGTMDYPVSVELIEAAYDPDFVTFKLAVGVHPTLRLRIPRLPAASEPHRRKPFMLYSFRDGVPYAMPAEFDIPSATVTDLDAVEVRLGSGPVAEELRRLGMASPVKSCTWGEALTAAFYRPLPVSPAPSDPPSVP